MSMWCIMCCMNCHLKTKTFKYGLCTLCKSIIRPLWYFVKIYPHLCEFRANKPVLTVKNQNLLPPSSNTKDRMMYAPFGAPKKWKREIKQLQWKKLVSSTKKTPGFNMKPTSTERHDVRFEELDDCRLSIIDMVKVSLSLMGISDDATFSDCEEAKTPSSIV